MRRIVDNVAFSWIGPVFFAALLAAQILSAAIAARYTGAFPWPDSVLIGFGMLGRAELAFVVLDIAFVQARIISEEVFYTLMLTAFWLNVAVPVSIALWKPYYVGEKSMGFLAPPGRDRKQ